MNNRIDLGGNYMIIEGGGYYSIVTPEGSAQLPSNIFWRMIAEFCPRVMRGDIPFNDNYTWGTWGEDTVTTVI